MKRSVRVLVALLLLVTLVPVSAFAAEEQPIKVYFQGELMKFSVDPVIVNGTTLVQFRPIFEALDMEITWDPVFKRVQGSNKDTGKNVDLYLDMKQASANGRAYELDVAPTLMEGNTMVPLRFVAQASGKVVTWYPKTRTITITKGYEKNADKNPYAGDSFVQLKDMNDHMSPNQPHIWERDGYTYVMWTKEVTLTPEFQGTSFFVSVAKDGKWIKQNEQMNFQRKESGNTYSYFYADGSYFWRSNSSITKITPSETGGATTEVVANYLLSLQGEVAAAVPVYVDGHASVLYRVGQNKYNTIYYKDGNSYKNVDVKDIYGVLNNLPSTTILNYDSGKKILYLIDDNGYRQLDIVSGDLKYGRDGKDLVIEFQKDARPGTTVRYFFEGDLYNFYMDNENNTYKIYMVTDGMVVSEPIISEIVQQDLYNRDFTTDGESLRFWNVYEFSRKPSLQLLSFSR